MAVMNLYLADAEFKKPDLSKLAEASKKSVHEKGSAEAAPGPVQGAM